MSNHKFEPQCKTRADLHREMARVLDMCEGFPRVGYPLYISCVKYNEDVPPHYDGLPHLYMEDIDKYEFALAIVEGKPVFRGDVLYPKLGQQETFIPVGLDARGNPFSDEGWHYHVDGLSWNPPQSTIEINGVKVKAPDFVNLYDPHQVVTFGRPFILITYDSIADAEAFKAAMEGK